MHDTLSIAPTIECGLLAWIPLLPLLSFVVLILIGRRLGRLSAWLSVAALAGAGLLTCSLASQVFAGDHLTVRWAWLSMTDPRWSIGLAVDELTWLMLAIITSIGTMIQVYSIGYMHDDPRFSRFFAYLSLFCASMLCLVMADHFVLLYAGWELVGLCSYLLISFWFEKPAAARAGRKAFLTTRIGDTGLLVGILLLAFAGGGLGFSQLVSVRDDLLMNHPNGYGLLTLMSSLMFLGAVGKSAQVPLHVWLPDAMEGPTPVSALIHAATMVAAGVYLVARTFPLFTPSSLAIVLGVGLTTHLFAGTVALTMTDIKKVLAYSTISQLGLMMTALGLGAVPQAMFHLTTHAYFKALLFLGAGSVIHATHQQELAQLGGLARVMPWTRWTFLIAALAMSGIFPLSGFWSKDAVLLEAWYRAPWVFWGLVVGAVMTAGYVFRLYFRCFHGPLMATKPAQGHGVSHASPHESPAIMTAPLTALAVGAAAVGLWGSPWLGHGFFALLHHDVHEGLDLPMLAVSTAVAGLGIGLAWQVGFRRRNFVPAALRPVARGMYVAASNKYFVDECYEALVIRPFFRATQLLARFDLRTIDGMVDRAGSAGWSLSRLKDAIDRRIVDRAVNGVAELARTLGAAGRQLQTGIVQHYLLGVVAAVVLIAVWLR